MNKFIRLIRYDWPMHFVLFLTNWFPDNLALIRLRGFLVTPFFLKAGRNLQIGRNVTFYNPSKIQLGSNVYIAQGCWFSAKEIITIGNNVLLGPYVVVVTSNHSIKNNAYYFGDPVNVMPVYIMDGSWIGAHVTILSGSVVNNGCLIGANSVYNGKSEKFSIYAGIPAKFIKSVLNERC